MINVVLLIILLLFSAVLSTSETSLFSLSFFTLKSYKFDADTRKRLIAHLLARPRELLVTIMMLNILANVLVQNTVSNIFGAHTSWLLKVGVPLVLTLFIGEIIPKSIAIANNKTIAYRVSPFIAFIARLLGPIRKTLTLICSFISRVLFFFIKKEKPLSTEELHHIIESSKKTGVLSLNETELAGGYLDLQESLIKEKMKPKHEIIYYNISNPLTNLIDLFAEKKCSRIPICEGGIDKILGIIYIRDFFFYQETIKNVEDLKKIMIKPFFSPETTKGWDLLQNMRKHQEHLCIVVDEYGLICGLITQEDLIETVVGEIEDIRDVDHLYIKSSNDVIIANGKLEISAFEDIFNIKLKNKSLAVTLNGWLIDQLETIPLVGEKFVTDDFLFYVLEADPQKVKKIYIRKLKIK